MTSMLDAPAANHNPYKPSERCLSDWQIYRMALNGMDPQERGAFERILEGCAHCRSAYNQARADRASAEHEPLPAQLATVAAALKKPRPVPRWRQWIWAGLPSMVFVATAYFVFVAPAKQPARTRVKGPVFEVRASLRRSEAWVLDEAPWAKLKGAKKPRDQIKLRIVGTAWPDVFAPVVWLEGYENDKWQPYFHGVLPADGWVPEGIGVTDGGETRLRVSICADETADRCVEETLDL